MKIVYSIDAKLGGSGIGHIAYNAAAGLYQAGLLTRLFVSSNAQTTIPAHLTRHWSVMGRVLKYLAVKDRTGLIYFFEGALFDAWVAAQLPQGDIFHGWNSMCLRTLHRAKQHGMLTIVERASSHPATQIELLREEYRRWNVPLRLPMWNYARSIRELEEADRITIPSRFVRDSMIAAGIPEEKLIEIPFGVNLKLFSPDPAPAAHPFRAIFAGQVSIRKGVPYLLEAWRRLGWRDAELWIIGAIAPDFAALRNRWADLASVRYIAHSTELVQLLRQGDVFVFPSIEEGSALVTYEAMACGLPVITTPNAGSVARDGEEGYIVPIRDVDMLCQCMSRLRVESELRAQMGQSARKRAEQFAWKQYQAELITGYQSVVKE